MPRKNFFQVNSIRKEFVNVLEIYGKHGGGFLNFFLFFRTIRSFPVNCICSLIVYLSIRYVYCSLPNLSIFRMLVELRDLKVKMNSKISK